MTTFDEDFFVLNPKIEAISFFRVIMGRWMCAPDLTSRRHYAQESSVVEASPMFRTTALRVHQPGLSTIHWDPKPTLPSADGSKQQQLSVVAPSAVQWSKPIFQIDNFKTIFDGRTELTIAHVGATEEALEYSNQRRGSLHGKDTTTSKRLRLGYRMWGWSHPFRMGRTDMPKQQRSDYSKSILSLFSWDRY